MKPRYEQPGLSGGTTLTCFARREHSYEFAWHHHREYELTLITEGTGTRYVGDTAERYQCGDMVLLGPDLPHTFVSGRGQEWAGAVVTQFRYECLGPGFFALPQFSGVECLLSRSGRGLSFGRASDGARELLVRMPRLEAAAQTVTFLDVLRRLASDTAAAPVAGPGYLPVPSAAVSDRLDAVCGHLQRAHTEPVCLAQIAALVHMSPTSLSRFFSRAMGRTLTDYVNGLRVETACSLLTSTSLRITEVAARSGYRNLSNFNRRFLEIKGVRPTEYRAARRGEAAASRLSGTFQPVGAAYPRGQTGISA